jgi:hypothetical protein
MIKRVATVILTGSIQLLNAVGYLFGMIAALFGVLADTLDRVRTLINTPADDEHDPYDDIHNADDPNITKNYKKHINE